MINYMWVDIMNHLKEHFYLFLSFDESFLQFSLNMYCSMIFFPKISREVAVLQLGGISKRLEVNFGNGPETCNLQAGWISLQQLQPH